MIWVPSPKLFGSIVKAIYTFLVAITWEKKQKKHFSISVFHIFKIVQMVPYRATHHTWNEEFTVGFSDA